MSASAPSSRVNLWRRGGPVLWSLYLLWRAPDWGFLHGVPLTPLAVVALFAVWWTWSIRRRLPGRTWLLLALVAKIVVGALLVPKGLNASYYTNTSWQGSPERGLFGDSPRETRTDASLKFGNGAPDFPLYFLNELRHNHAGVMREPLSAEWSGQLVVTGDQFDLTLYLSGRNLEAEAFIDGFHVVGLTTAEREATGHVRARPPTRRLSVKLSSPSGIPTEFEAGVVDPASGRRVPFGREDVLLSPASPAHLLFDRIVTMVTQLIDAAALLALAIAAVLALLQLRSLRAAGWRQILVPLLSALAFGEALTFAHHAVGHFQLLAWGSDRLTYESFARDIMFHGPLMTLGAPLGRGEAFYYQPLYPYFLSAVHLITGEGFWGIYLCQRLGFAIICYALWSIADRLFDRSTAAAALILAFWLTYIRLYDYSAAMYNESLFLPLLIVWTLWLCREAAKPGSQNIGTGAMLGGLATLTRSTLVSAWPLAAGALAIAYRRHGGTWERLIRFSLILVAVVSVATMRNAIVAHQLVPITTSLGQNLRDGNAGAESLMRGLWAKAAYTLGVENILGTTRLPAFSTALAIQRVMPWIWVAALLGGTLLLIDKSLRRADGPALLMPVAVALSQFVVVVVIFPYSERLVLPFYAPLIPYAAIPFGLLLNRIGLLAGRKEMVG